MKIIRNIERLKKELHACRKQNKSIGFVPTMGALHAGHEALLKRCKEENDLAVLSIFVNPTQFGPSEDYQTYPRTLASDAKKARAAKIDIIFCPTLAAMYPDGSKTSVVVDPRLTDVLCGRPRPGHFHGVATVVTKLLNIVQPDIVYFGQKDAQQCAVIKRLIADLNIPAVRMKILPTVRDKDGLALSSRNAYLSPTERKEAVVLFEALQIAATAIAAGQRNPKTVLRQMQRHIQTHSSGEIDYVEIVDPNTLKPVKSISQKVLVALAIRFRRARLIDNRIVPSYNG